MPRRGGGGRRKEHPNSFDSSMRAIHDVSSGSLHAGVMKAFLRGSTRANWPSWVNRGGGAERIHQTSPHLCENVEGAPRSGITSQRIKHVRSAFSLFTSPLSSFYPLILAPHVPPPTPNLPPDLPSSLSPSQTPDSLPCQWINRKALCDRGGHCMPRLHTNILLKSHPPSPSPPHAPPRLTRPYFRSSLGQSLHLSLNPDGKLKNKGRKQHKKHYFLVRKRKLLVFFFWR